MHYLNLNLIYLTNRYQKLKILMQLYPTKKKISKNNQAKNNFFIFKRIYFQKQ